MDIRNAAFASGDDPLHMPEWAVDGLDILPLTDERLFG
jgi:hypothetical protein